MVLSSTARMVSGRTLQYPLVGLKLVESHSNVFLLTTTRSFASSQSVFSSKRFVSRSTSSMQETPIDLGITVGQTVERQKPKWEEKADLRRRIAGSGVLPTVAEVLKDFRYKLVTNVNQDLVEERFRGVPEEKRPVVILCGWAGSTPKNLHKYSEIYHRAGCITLDYNLPSRFVFTETCEVPHIAKELLKVMDEAKLMERPLFLHLMSDTGLMVFQGLDLVSRDHSKRMNIAGTILDSCPGPRPKGTITRLLTLGAVNWICSVKDGLPWSGVLRESIRYARLRMFPSIWRYFQGLPVELSMMNETWAGDFYRDAKSKKWPELFLYSKSDAYLPYQYLEQEVLAPRTEVGRDFRTKCWTKSPHVSHLRANPAEYEAAVLDFIYDKYFKAFDKKQQ